MPVMGFHVHVMDPENLQPWTRDPEQAHGLAWAAGGDVAREWRGVRRGLTEISPITTGVISNGIIAEFCGGQVALVLFANINPFTVANPAQELERYVLETGFEGLKLYPTYQGFYANDSMVCQLYAKADELKIPLVIRTGSSMFAGARLGYGDSLWPDDVAVCGSTRLGMPKGYTSLC
jgi:hypothetical protein